MTDHNGPRHARDSDGNPPDSVDRDSSHGDRSYGDHSYGSAHDATYDSAYDYDPAYAYPAAAAGDVPGAPEEPRAGAAGAAGAGAGAAAGTGAGDADAEKSGPPLRGFAMILTAVAVVLILWGAFSLFGNDDGDGDSAADTSTAGQPAAPAPQSGAPATPAQGTEVPGDGAGAPAPEASAPAPAPGDTPPAPADGAPAGTVPVDKGIAVTVLNNSNVEGGADSRAGQLREDRWTSVATGNLPGATYPASGVYYPGDNPAAEAAARQVAQDLGIAAVEARSDEDNRNFATARTPGGGEVPVSDVVVVLTADQLR